MDYSSYIKEAFGIAKDHGSHDVELPVNHFIMLIITEISEMVEADRKKIRVRFPIDSLENMLHLAGSISAQLLLPVLPRLGVYF